MRSICAVHWLGAQLLGRAHIRSGLTYGQLQGRVLTTSTQLKQLSRLVSLRHVGLLACYGPIYRTVQIYTTVTARFK